MNTIFNFLKLFRIHQYAKNGFIFLPLFFSAQITKFDLLTANITAFIAFSLTASSIYIFNDYLDINEDKKHPKKKFRPLASGQIKPGIALCFIFLLSITGFLIMYKLSFTAFSLLLFYFLMNIAYTLKLKHIPIIDIFIISLGFIIRLFIGAVTINNNLSHWIVIMTFLLALFLAFAKRRDDFLHFKNSGEKLRKNIDGYSLQLIDASMCVMASTVFVSYILYTLSIDALQGKNFPYLFLTSIFVLLGIFRYMQITFVEEKSGSPTEILLKDRLIQFSVASFLISYGLIIYYA